MRIGVVFPCTEVGADSGALREWAQAVERMGFKHIVIYDHVIGANPASRPGKFMPYNVDSAFYDPFTIIPFMAAATTTITFFTSILILPQRQTVLVAKQAACTDVLCNGRLRIGVGTGWNDTEYEALNARWTERGKIFEDQIGVLRELWTKRAVTLKTQYHTITDAGIKPLPIQQPIPLWFGGGAKEPISGKQSPERVLRRIARLADGLAAAVLEPDDYAVEMLDRFWTFCRGYGRDVSKIGVEGQIAVNRTNDDRTTDRVKAWQDIGATHVGFNTMRDGLSGVEQHLRRLEEIAEALYGEGTLEAAFQ
jgi:probable F420-dependent oxidoreductase